MSGHTPGPWRLDTADGYENPRAWTIWGPCGRAIAQFPNLVHEARAQLACDARLIAAAPQLLAFAKEQAAACEHCDNGNQSILADQGHFLACEWCADIRALIDLATKGPNA